MLRFLSAWDTRSSRETWSGVPAWLEQLFSRECKSVPPQQDKASQQRMWRRRACEASRVYRCSKELARNRMSKCAPAQRDDSPSHALFLYSHIYNGHSAVLERG